MSLQDKYFDPKIYTSKVTLLIILFIIDIIGNCFTQFMDFGNKNTMNAYNLIDYTPMDEDLSYAIFAYIYLVITFYL